MTIHRPIQHYSVFYLIRAFYIIKPWTYKFNDKSIYHKKKLFIVITFWLEE